MQVTCIAHHCTNASERGSVRAHPPVTGAGSLRELPIVVAPCPSSRSRQPFPPCMRPPSPYSRHTGLLCGRRHAPLVLEPTITQHEHAIESIEDLFVVGDRDDGGILVQSKLAQQVHDDLRALRIQRRRGLVGKDDARAIGERAGYGDALGFATRQLCREGVLAVADLEIFEEFNRTVARQRSGRSPPVAARWRRCRWH